MDRLLKGFTHPSAAKRQAHAWSGRRNQKVAYAHSVGEPLHHPRATGTRYASCNHKVAQRKQIYIAIFLYMKCFYVSVSDDC